MVSITIIILFFVAYLLGSIPFGLLLTRMAGMGDIRTVGSGNIGATNVLRTGRMGIAAATLLLDIAKGALTVELAYLMNMPQLALATGVFAILGHLYPVWLKFKGGKGVATAIGVYLGYAWPLGLAVILAWLAIFALTRISSLAALLALCIAAPLFAYTQFGGQCALLSLLIGLLIAARHKDNIVRLLKGEEHAFRKGNP